MSGKMLTHFRVLRLITGGLSCQSCNQMLLHVPTAF